MSWATRSYLAISGVVFLIAIAGFAGGTFAGGIAALIMAVIPLKLAGDQMAHEEHRRRNSQ